MLGSWGVCLGVLRPTGVMLATPAETSVVTTIPSISPPWQQRLRFNASLVALTLELVPLGCAEDGGGGKELRDAVALCCGNCHQASEE